MKVGGGLEEEEEDVQLDVSHSDQCVTPSDHCLSVSTIAGSDFFLYNVGILPVVMG